MKSYSNTMFLESFEDARAEEDLLRRRFGRAAAFVNTALGFNAWSRGLEDNILAVAFCVPDEVYDDKEICERLADWFSAVFAAHYLAADGEWRDSSARDEYTDASRYQVDCSDGSKPRSVNIGPHYYMCVRPKFAVGNTPSDPAAHPCSTLPTWTVIHEMSGLHTVNIVAECLKETTDLEGDGHEGTTPQCVL